MGAHWHPQQAGIPPDDIVGLFCSVAMGSAPALMELLPGQEVSAITTTAVALTLDGWPSSYVLLWFMGDREYIAVDEHDASNVCIATF